MTNDIEENTGGKSQFEVARRAWKRLAHAHKTGEYRPFFEMLTDDHVFYAAAGEQRGEIVGREANEAFYLDQQRQAIIIYGEPHTVAVGGTTVFFEFEVEGRLQDDSGRSFRSRNCFAFDVRGDKISAIREYFGDFNPQFVSIVIEQGRS